MNPEDDPEARIRALEQPLSEQARSSELGSAQPSGQAYLPPPAPAYAQPDYTTPAYGTQPYGTQPYGTQQYESQQYGGRQYGNQPWNPQPYEAPSQKVSAGIPWLVFGVIAVVFVAVAAGIIIVMTRLTSAGTQDHSDISSGGGSVDISIPSAPSVPSVEIPSPPAIPAPPGAPNADPNVITGVAGQTVTVSGIDENKTVACNDAAVTISGIRNTVTITGHCVNVSVSGVENKITVDAADAISASGFDNVVTFISGDPQIDNTGSNTVQRG